MSAYIPVDLRDRIRIFDCNRCCYCRTTELNSGMRMVFDHIYPRSKEGETVFENLCLACRACNEFKSDFVSRIDPVTDQEERLFHPRMQVWQEHFEWSASGIELQGKTGVGRVTVAVLQMNNSAIVAARKRWVAVGWHPPD